MIRKICIPIILLLCLVFSGMIIQSHEPSTFTTATTYFWMSFEEGDNDGAYNITGTYDYSAHDQDGTYSSDAAVVNGSILVGTYSLHIPTEYDFQYFVDTADGVPPFAEGRIGFWFRKYSAWAGGYDENILEIDYNSDNRLKIRTMPGGDFGYIWRAGGSDQVTESTSVDSYTIDTNYFIEFAWDTVNNKTAMWIDGTQVLSSTDSISEIQWEYLRLGGGRYLEDFYIDNVIIVDDYDSSIPYDQRNETSYPG